MASHNTRMAEAIYKAFDEGVSLVFIMTPPQFGKTETFIQAIRMSNTAPDRVFVITGMSDKDWVAQTKSRMDPALRDRVFHLRQLHRLTDLITPDTTDALVVIDECHIANASNQTLHRALRDAGLLDLASLRARSIKILAVSATPGAILHDARAWGPENFRLIADNGRDTPGYVGIHTMLAEGRIRDLPGFREALVAINERFSPATSPSWVIVRAAATRQSALKDIARELGFSTRKHDSKARIKEIYDLLAAPPPPRVIRTSTISTSTDSQGTATTTTTTTITTHQNRHTIIFIKGMWRAAKTLPDTYLAACIETTATKDSAVVAQSLAGRMCGFGKRTGEADAPLFFGNLKALQQYMSYLDADADPAAIKKYDSKDISIKKGTIKKKKETVAHRNNVRNLPDAPADSGGSGSDPSSSTADPPPPRPHKVGMVATPPADARLATTITRDLSSADFEAKFGIRLPANTNNRGYGRKLHSALKKVGIHANCSSEESSIKDAGSLLNYGKKGWASKPYHIVIMPTSPPTFTVIQRDTTILDNPAKGNKVVVHNAKGELILYKYV